MAKKRSSKSAKFQPTPEMRIVVLHGQEPYLLSYYTRQLREVLEEAHGEVAEFEYDGTQADLAPVLDELRSYGLMQPHKLVILDNADQFLAGGEDRTRRTALENYAGQPVDHSTLLMRAETWRKSNLDKLIEKVGTIHKLEPLTDDRLRKWCRHRLEERYDATIDADAIEALIERLGEDMANLDTELAKLASYVGAGGTITRDHVAEMVGLSREERAFALQAPIAAGRPDEALTTLHELLDISRQPEELIAWAIMDVARRVHSASRMMADGASSGSIRSSLRVFGPAGEAILSAARRVPPAEAARLLNTAVEADRRRKSGYGETIRTLETLTCQIADAIARSSSTSSRAG